VWVAGVCGLVLGVGDGAAVACNALLVQRGTFDVLRGRALTFVMSVTYVLLGIGQGLGGLFLLREPAQRAPWIWGGAGGVLLVAALAGWLLARQLRSETAADAERVRRSESKAFAAIN
jgi:MFS family permease